MTEHSNDTSTATPASEVSDPQETPNAEAAGTAPKRSRKRLVVGVMLTVLLVALSVGGVFGYQAYLEYVAAQAEEARLSEVRRLSTATDEILEKVWDTMTESDRRWALTTEDERANQLPRLITSTTSDIERCVVEVAEARAIAETIPDEDVAEVYLGVCSSLDAVYESALLELTRSKEIAEQVDAVWETARDISKAHELLSDSTQSCNSHDYRDGEKQAKEAKSLFTAAVKSYTAVNEIIDDIGLERHIKWLSACIEQADMQITLSNYGRTRGVSTYNRQVNAVNSHDAEVWKMSGADYDPDFGYDVVQQEAGDLIHRTRGANARLDRAQEAAVNVFDPTVLIESEFE